MGFSLKKLRKEVGRGLKKGASLTYKPLDDGIDVVKDIIEKPYRAPLTLAKQGLKRSFNPVYNVPFAGNVVDEFQDQAWGQVRKPLGLVGSKSMDVLNKFDDVFTGGAVLFGSDLERTRDGGLNPDWISPKDLFTQNPIKRFDRNVDVIEQQTDRKLSGSFGKSAKGLFPLFDEAGKAFDYDPDVDPGVKFTGQVLGDPTTYLPGGIVRSGFGRGFKALGLSDDLLKKAPVLKKAGGILGEVIAGFDDKRALAGFTAGGALATSLASRTKTPYDDFIAPFVGGAVGMVKFRDYQDLGRMASGKVKNRAARKRIKDNFIKAVTNSEDDPVVREILGLDIQPESIANRIDELHAEIMDIEDQIYIPGTGDLKKLPREEMQPLLRRHAEIQLELDDLGETWRSSRDKRNVPRPYMTKEEEDVLIKETNNLMKDPNSLDEESLINQLLRINRLTRRAYELRSDELHDAFSQYRDYIESFVNKRLGLPLGTVIGSDDLGKEIRLMFPDRLGNVNAIGGVRQIGGEWIPSRTGEYLSSSTRFETAKDAIRDLVETYLKEKPVDKRPRPINDPFWRSMVSDEDGDIEFNEIIDNLDEFDSMPDDIILLRASDSYYYDRTDTENLLKDKRNLLSGKIDPMEFEDANDLNNWIIFQQQEKEIASVYSAYFKRKADERGLELLWRPENDNIEIEPRLAIPKHYSEYTDDELKYAIDNLESKKQQTRDAIIEYPDISIKEGYVPYREFMEADYEVYKYLDELVDYLKFIQGRRLKQQRGQGPMMQMVSDEDLAGKYEINMSLNTSKLQNMPDDELTVWAYGGTANLYAEQADAYRAKRNEGDELSISQFNSSVIGHELGKVRQAAARKILEDRGINPDEFIGERELRIPSSRTRELRLPESAIHASDLSVKEISSRIDVLKYRINEIRKIFKRAEEGKIYKDAIEIYKEELRYADDLLDYYEFKRGQKLRQQQGSQGPRMGMIDDTDKDSPEYFEQKIKDYELDDLSDEELIENILYRGSFTEKLILDLRRAQSKGISTHNTGWGEKNIPIKKGLNELEVHAEIGKYIHAKYLEEAEKRGLSLPERDNEIIYDNPDWDDANFPRESGHKIKGMKDVPVEIAKPRHASELDIEDLDIRIKFLEEFITNTKEDLNSPHYVLSTGPVLKTRTEMEAVLEEYKAAYGLLDYYKFLKGKRLKEQGGSGPVLRMMSDEYDEELENIIKDIENQPDPGDNWLVSDMNMAEDLYNNALGYFRDAQSAWKPVRSFPNSNTNFAPLREQINRAEINLEKAKIYRDFIYRKFEEKSGGERGLPSFRNTPDSQSEIVISPRHVNELTVDDLTDKIKAIDYQINNAKDEIITSHNIAGHKYGSLAHYEVIKHFVELKDFYKFLKGKKLKESGQPLDFDSFKMQMISDEDNDIYINDDSWYKNSPNIDEYKIQDNLETSMDDLSDLTGQLARMKGSDSVEKISRLELNIELAKSRLNFWMELASEKNIDMSNIKRLDFSGLNEQGFSPRHASELSVDELDFKIKDLEKTTERAKKVIDDTIKKPKIYGSSGTYEEYKLYQRQLRHELELLDYYKYLKNRKMRESGRGFTQDVQEEVKPSPFLSLKRDVALAGFGAAAGYAATGEEEGALEGAGLGFLAGGIWNKPTNALRMQAIGDNDEIPSGPPIGPSSSNGMPYVPGSRMNVKQKAQSIRAGGKRIQIKNELRVDESDVAPYNPETNPTGEINPLKRTLVPPSIKKEEAHVRTYGVHDPRRILGIIANPDVLQNTKVGRLLVAHRRVMLKSRTMADAIISGNIDSFAGKWGVRDILGDRGTVFNTDENGIVTDLGVHWSTVVGKPDYDDRLNPMQLEFVTTFREILEDLNTLRMMNAIDQLQVHMADGSIYVPRAVNSYKDIQINGRTDYQTRSLFERIEDGIADGANYRDPRDVLRMYINETFDDVAAKQLMDELQNYSISLDDLIDPNLKIRLEAAEAEERTAAINHQAAKEARERSIARIPKKLSPEKRKERIVKHDKLVTAAHREQKSKVGAVQKIRREINEAKKLQRQRLREHGGVAGHYFGKTDEHLRASTWSHKFLGNKNIFKQEDYDRIVDAIGLRGISKKEPDPGFVSKVWKNLGDMSRFLLAGFDAGTPFTHGLPVLFENPILWGRAVGNQFKAIAQPGARDQIVKNHMQTVQKMAKYGVDIADPEQFAAIEHGGAIPSAVNKVLSLTGSVGGSQEAKRRITNQVFKQTAGRFASGHNAFLLEARRLLWESNEHKFKDPYELAQWINELTGGVNSQMLGASRTQRNWESTWMAFSPRLVRSTMALAADALKPSIRDESANRAKVSALKMLGGMTALYMGTVMLMHQDELSEIDNAEDFGDWLKKRVAPGLNPLAGKEFLSIKIGDEWYGVGGNVRALAQLVGGVMMNPVDVLSASEDNPLINFYRSRGAPALDASTTLIEGTTGLDANPYEDIDGSWSMLESMGYNNVPFWITAIVEGESAGGVSGGFFGLRTSKETTRESLEEASIEMFGKPRSKLNQEEKDKFYAQYPPKRDPNDPVTQYFDNIDTINKEWAARIQRAGQLVRSGQMSKPEFRIFYQKETAAKANKIEGVRRTFSTIGADVSDFDGSVIDFLESKEVPIEDKAVSDWYDLPDRFINEDTLEIDWDGLEEARANFLEGLSPGVRSYVIRMTHRENPHELVDEMKNVQQQSKIYFEANNDVWTQMREDGVPGLFQQFEDYAQFRRWVDKTAQENLVSSNTVLNQLEKTIPAFRFYNKYVTEYKRLIRVFDPELNEGLMEWYEVEPANRIDYALQGTGQSGSDELNNYLAANRKANSSEQTQRLVAAIAASTPNRPQRTFNLEQSRFAQRRLSLRNS